MNHTHAVRVDVETGEKTDVNFGQIDGKYFHQEGHTFAGGRLTSFDIETALLIVNRWNYVAQLQSTPIQWLYYLPTADGAI
jgi:hypothetical protein